MQAGTLLVGAGLLGGIAYLLFPRGKPATASPQQPQPQPPPPPPVPPSPQHRPLPGLPEGVEPSVKADGVFERNPCCDANLPDIDCAWADEVLGDDTISSAIAFELAQAYSGYPQVSHCLEVWGEELRARERQAGDWSPETDWPDDDADWPDDADRPDAWSDWPWEDDVDWPVDDDDADWQDEEDAPLPDDWPDMPDDWADDWFW